MKKIIFIFLMFISLIMLGSCNKAESDLVNNSEGESGMTPIINDDTRKIYYTLSYGIQTNDLNKRISEINNKVLAINGYVASSNESINEDSKGYANYVYKVPTEHLEDFMNFMNGVNGVTNKTVSSSDITSAYSQTSERLKTLYASKAAYTKILSNDNLNVNEVISINNRIEDIDTEIKVLEAKIASYDNLVEYSTVTINFNQDGESNFFATYWNYIKNLFIGLFYIVVYTLPIALIGFGLFSVIFFPIRKTIRKKQNKINA